MSRFIIILIAATSCFSCKKEQQDVVVFKQFSGGIDNTVFDISQNAFGYPSPGISNYEELLFAVGNSFFRQNWVSAPASTTARDGLGPYFNARNCSSCHFKDGRGRPPNFTGELSTGLLIRLSIPGIGEHGGPLGHQSYGRQLQDASLPELLVEGDLQITYVDISGTFSDGTPYSLRKPTYSIISGNYGALDAGLMMSPRVGQQMIGLGLLEAISENTLMNLCDEFDSDGNGISGKLNYVWDEVNKRTSVGRFGWKANQPSLYQQTAGAFLGDLGITTELFNVENCSDSQVDCGSIVNGGVPEITNDDLEKVVLYLSNLAVPAQRDYEDEVVVRGGENFSIIGCASCHIPSLVTANHSKFSNLSNQRIAPYTDLLLHDMGSELADNRPDFLANGNEWRTQPLWGLGLIETVNGHTYLLHDGRARNIEEAILWHGGEGEASKKLFIDLPAKERESILTFLKSL